LIEIGGSTGGGSSCSLGGSVSGGSYSQKVKSNTPAISSACRKVAAFEPTEVPTALAPYAPKSRLRKTIERPPEVTLP